LPFANPEEKSGAADIRFSKTAYAENNIFNLDELKMLASKTMINNSLAPRY